MSKILTIAKTLAACSLLATMAICSGCGNETPELAQKSSEDLKQNSQSENTAATSVATSPINTEVSPANIARKAPAEDTFDQSPEGLCRRFMELLQNNESIKAETLMTRMSQMNTTKEELELKAIGGPSAKFTIGQVSYATMKKELAQVECKIVDTSSDDPFEMEMTWLVKRQNKSWRISGVMLQLEEGARNDLLSFENLADVRRIKSINDEQLIAENNEQLIAENENLQRLGRPSDRPKKLSCSKLLTSKPP